MVCVSDTVHTHTERVLGGAQLNQAGGRAVARTPRHPLHSTPEPATQDLFNLEAIMCGQACSLHIGGVQNSVETLWSLRANSLPCPFLNRLA